MKTLRSQRRERDEAHFWEAESVGDLRLLHGRYSQHRFPPHFHYCYSIGVIVEGAMRYRHLGRPGLAPPGSIFLINPGEVHSGEGEGGAWAFRSFYVGERRLSELASLLDAGMPAPVFRGPIVQDGELASRLLHLHHVFETSPEILEQESSEVDALALLLLRHCVEPPTPARSGAERGAVRRARALIEERYGEELSLKELAAEVGLSAFHFLRVFQEEVGLTPHRYLTQVRIERSRALLVGGASIAQTALACGFVDQSHLTRHFKRLLGCTPGAFLRACRGSRPFARESSVEEWLARARGRIWARDEPAEEES